MAAQNQPFLPEYRARSRSQQAVQATEAVVNVVDAERPGRPNAGVTDAAAAPATVRYQTVQVEAPRLLSQLKSKLGDQAVEIAMRVNRLDLNHLRQAKSLVVPDSAANLLSLSPLPAEIEQARELPKLVLISRRVQAFGAYENGRLVRWGPTSTGKKSTPTPAGLYNMNWKSVETRSSVNRDWRLPWYFNLDNVQGIALHQFDLPGYPASHGCVRLLKEDAQWFYTWGDQWITSKSNHKMVGYGTPVLIFGDYSHKELAPWKRLPEDPNAATLRIAEVLEALSPHLPVIVSRVHSREALIASSTTQQPIDRPSDTDPLLNRNMAQPH